MAAKTVVAQFPSGSRKKVKFLSDITGDLKPFKEEFLKIFESDEHLRATMSTSEVLIQFKDTDLGLFDVEDRDVIPDKCTLYIDFVTSSVVDLSSIPTMNAADLSSMASFTDQVLSTKSIHEITLCDTPKPIQEITLCDTSETVSEPPLKKAKLSSQCPGKSDVSKSELSKSGVSKSEVSTTAKRAKKSKSKPVSLWRSEDHPGVSPPASVYRLPDPVPLPTFSHSVLQSIKRYSVIQTEALIVQECAAHLLSMTSDYPSRTEYDEYSRTVVAAFPDLAAGNASKSPWNCFKDMLTKHIRNHRYTENKKSKARGKEGPGKTPSSVMKASVVETGLGSPKPASPPKDGYSIGPSEEAHLAELKRVGAEGDEVHIKELLRETKSYRKHWLLKDNKTKNFDEISREWPHLKRCELIVDDFFVTFDYKQEKVEESFRQFISKLLLLYKEPEEPSDAKVMLLLSRLQRDLNGKRKNRSEVISVHEAGKSLDKLTAEEDESARLVVFYAGDIVTDASLLLLGGRVALPEPLVPVQCIAALLASYYVFDMNYPEPFLPMLATLDNFVLGTDVKY